MLPRQAYPATTITQTHRRAPRPAAVGGSVEGTLEHGGDSDVFVFEADADALYRIDVILSTLDDSLLILYDADGRELAHNDDYGGTYASRIEWQAPAAGDYYLWVEGYGVGAYSLIITTIPNVDDHADAPEDATPTVLGGSIEGTLHHGGDVDMFVFEAEEGALYRIDVTLGSLGDSVLTLYDVDGQELAYNDDHGGSAASRIEWQAPEPGDYYLAVEGWGGSTGAYTLAITSIGERGSDR